MDSATTLRFVRNDAVFVTGLLAQQATPWPIHCHAARSRSIQSISPGVAKAKEYTGTRFRFTDQRPKAKSLAFRIVNAQKAQKDQLDPERLNVAKRVIHPVDRALLQTPSAQHWSDRLMPFRDLLMRVIDQTSRRVIQQENVPSTETMVSLFEPHTDGMVKGFRNLQYGHKIHLSSDAYGFLTDCRIEQGNPNDKAL